MKSLHIGDRVLTANGKYEAVYSFGHLHTSLQTDYLRIYTASEEMAIEMTSDHMISVSRKGGIDHMIPASMVEIGDHLRSVSLSDEEQQRLRVVRIDRVVGEGAFAPFTPSGTIVVNGVLASTFVAFSQSDVLGVGVSYQWLGQTFEAPHRWYCGVFDCTHETYDEGTGICTWVYHAWRLANWMVSLRNEGSALPLLLFGLMFVGMMWCLLLVWLVDEGGMLLVALLLLGLLRVVHQLLPTVRFHVKPQH